MDKASSSAPLLSVIIPTCHRNDALALCLEALRPDDQQVPFLYEVIVTDDGTQSTAEKLVREILPSAHWFPGPRQGPAANRNSGARNANGQWLLFLDDDCIPAPGWVRAYGVATNNFPDYKVFEGCTVGGPNARTRSDHECPVNSEGGLLWSCNFGIRRELFLDIGGFDEKFPVPYMEDTDLQFRLKDRGYISQFVPDASAQHPWRPRKGIYFSIAYARSLCYFIAKHPETRQMFASAWGIKRMIKIVTFEFPKNLLRFRDLSAFRVLYWDLLMAFEVSRNLSKK
jgi:GT2 family glycosyltransferase